MQQLDNDTRKRKRPIPCSLATYGGTANNFTLSCRRVAAFPAAASCTMSTSCFIDCPSDPRVRCGCAFLCFLISLPLWLLHRASRGFFSLSLTIFQIHWWTRAEKTFFFNIPCVLWAGPLWLTRKQTKKEREKIIKESHWQSSQWFDFILSLFGSLTHSLSESSDLFHPFTREYTCKLSHLSSKRQICHLTWRHNWPLVSTSRKVIFPSVCTLLTRGETVHSNNAPEKTY